MARLTEAREACLSTVAEGTVRRISFPSNGKAYYTVVPWMQKPRQAPYEWLYAHGYIKHGGPSLRGTPVSLTQKGVDYDGTNA